MGEHSTLVGGSSADRYINCIGSTALKDRAPPSETSEFAHEGTMLHFLTEDTLSQGEDFDPHDYIGDIIDLDETDSDGNVISIEVTEQHIVHKVLPAVQWFDNVLAPDEFWLELKVGFTGELDGAFGTADVLYISDDAAGIVDWKFGDGHNVEADDNTQLKFYLAAALKLPWFAEATKRFDEFHGYIVQPVEGREDQLVSHAVINRAELVQLEADLLRAKRAKDAGDNTLTVGPWCKFCPAETICPAWRNRGSEALASVPRETLSGKGRVEYDHDALREAYLLALEVGSWADAVKKRVKTEFDNARPIDGLKKVVYQMVRRFIPDEKKVRGWLRREGLKAADMNEPATLKSVAQIEKLIGKDKMREEFVEKVPGGFSYVPADDPRPAVDDGSDPQALSNVLAGALKKK